METGDGYCTTNKPSIFPYEKLGAFSMVCKGSKNIPCNKITKCWDDSTESSIECVNDGISTNTIACIVNKFN